MAEFDPAAPHEFEFNPDAPHEVETSLGDTAIDMARVVPGGLAKGVASIVGMPGSIHDLANAGIDKVVNAGHALIGWDPVKPQPSNPLSASSIAGYMSAPTGGFYEPKTGIGAFTEKAMEFAPMAAGGPASWYARLMRVLAPTVGEEGGGALTKGTALEPYARGAGAVLGGGLETLGENIPNAAMRSVYPIEKSAVEEIERHAGGPLDIDPRQYVPGSEPSLVHAITTPNPGVSQLYRSMRDATGNNAIVTQEMASTQARNDFFDKLAGTPGDIESMKLAREAATKNLREDAFANSTGPADATGVMKAIAKTLNSPAGQRDTVQKALSGIAEKLQVENPLSERVADALGPIKDQLSAGKLGADRRVVFTEARRLLNSASRGFTSEEDLISGLKQLAKGQKTVGPIDDALDIIKSGNMKLQADPRQLYGIRQDIGDKLSPLAGADSSGARLAAGELTDVKKALDDAIETSAPGYKNYMKTFADLSRPIDRASYLQSLKMTDARGNVTLAKAKNALENTRAFRNDSGLHEAKSLTDDDMVALEALHDDLRAADNISLGKSIGSNTVQNAIANNSSMLPSAAKPFAGKYIRPDVTGAALGGALGGMVGAPELGAIAGGSVGHLIKGIVDAKNTLISNEIQKMLLNPRHYKNVSDAVKAGAGASSIAPLLLTNAAEMSALSRGQGLINSSSPNDNY